MRPPGKPMQRRPHAAGYSLLEMVLASAICTTALVPALALMRDGVEIAEGIDVRHLLAMYGVGKMEEQLAIVAATWTEGATSGDFAGEGHANVRFTVSRTDDPGGGGIADRLMNVTVTAYYDANGNDSLDAGEKSVTFTTKISKLATYEAKASS